MKRLQTALLAALTVGIGLLLLKFPAVASQAVQNALLLCTATVIPSLFPFLVLSSFLTLSRLAEKMGRFLDPVCHLLFHLPGCCFPALVLGLLGGYPTGAKMTAELLQAGLIDGEQAARMLHFVVNPGPAFVITAVGFSMLGSRRAGNLLFASLLLSSLLTGLLLGIFSRFRRGKAERRAASAVKKNSNPPGWVDAFVLSTAAGSRAMFSICGWILVFAVLSGCLSLLQLPSSLDTLLSCLLEVTGGVSRAAGRYSLPLICGALAFSGFSVHFQIMKYIRDIGMRYPLFLLSRLASGLLSAVICHLLLLRYPCDTVVFSNGMAALANPAASSLPAAVGLIFMGGILLLEVQKVEG